MFEKVGPLVTARDTKYTDTMTQIHHIDEE